MRKKTKIEETIKNFITNKPIEEVKEVISDNENNEIIKEEIKIENKSKEIESETLADFLF